MNLGSAARSDIEKGQTLTSSFLFSQQVSNQRDVVVFSSRPTTLPIFLVGAFMVGCKYLTEETVTSFPPDRPQTQTHTSPRLCITLIGAQFVQPLPDATLPSLSRSLPLSRRKLNCFILQLSYLLLYLFSTA